MAERRPMDKKRLALLVVALVLGIVGAALFPVDRLVVDDKYNIFSVIISIYPVLFGFSITTITLVGSLDNVLAELPMESLATYQDTYENKMLRQVLLGCIYVIVLLLALIVQVLPDGSMIYFIGCKIMIFLGVVSLLCALTTPFVLYELHAQKYELLLLKKGAPPTP